MNDLFTDFDATDEKATATAPAGPFAGVAIEQAIDRVLEYSVPKKLLTSLHVGQRVRVPLGRNNRPTHGFVVRLRDSAGYPKIKPLLGIDDERVLLAPPLIELALWMSRYYCAPLGVVIESIIPSAVKKKVGLDYTQVVRLAQPRERIQELLERTKARKRRAILGRLLLIEDSGIDIVKLAGEAGATVPTVRKLAKLGLIAIRAQADLPGLTSNLRESAADEADLALNEDQAKVFSDLVSRLDAGFSVSLFVGVTGSGKTEVYLQAIRRVVAAGKQAIVLVPEIALTPQTVRRFTARFKRVAVLHSGLSAGQRHRFWQQIAQGMADVVVGARSAVFAPVPNPGLIVVDEEHESSYKQDTAPRYHARDVAIKRAQIEKIPILLGSATPSLESWNRVSGAGYPVSGDASDSTPPKPETRSPKPDYHLLTLPHRVRGLALPTVELVDMATEKRFRRGIHLLSARLEALLRTTLAAGQQAILLLNRRGYSNFVYCPSCSNVVKCKYCDTTMTYHRSAGARAQGGSFEEGLHTGQLHCHYCLAVGALPKGCPVCAKKLNLFGLGTQRVEEELAKKFPEVTYARVDSDSMRGGRDYERTLGKFSRKEIQVLLGTQMIAKGLDYPNVTLVGVISGDTALALPDFRAAERTFQLITQVAGRAGRGDAPGRVLVQTFLPDDPSIRHAIKQDFPAFARGELVHRRDTGLPPYTRMVRVILRDQDVQKLSEFSQELAAIFAEAIAVRASGAIIMKGPMPCAIARIGGYFRHQITLYSPRATELQAVLAQVREKGALARGDRIAVDVDPVSLL